MIKLGKFRLAYAQPRATNNPDCGMQKDKRAAIDKAIRQIWGYLLLNQHLERADVILVLGCRNERVARLGASLYLEGYGRWVLISGGVGPNNNLLSTIWQEPTEAEHFAGVVLTAGVPEERVLLEKESTNTGENAVFSYALLKAKGIATRSIVAVHNPYVERRVFATFKRQWPDPETSIQVTSPTRSFDDWVGTLAVSKEEGINGLVNELRKLREYPELGYMDNQAVPGDVWDACEFLVGEGYG